MKTQILMSIPQIVKVLEHLYKREADCRCGGVQLTVDEIVAIKNVIDSLKEKK